MSNAIAIIQTCESVFETTKEDCNKFLKAVLDIHIPDHGLEGLNADEIIAVLSASADWQTLSLSQEAIACAKVGLIVVGGMTSTELGTVNGHLAVVVGDDGQPSGNPPVIVPICYPGSLGSEDARVKRKRVSATFPAKAARESKITYFSRPAI